jgi:hypothetical protein
VRGDEVIEVKKYHRQAMHHTDLALAAKTTGDEKAALVQYRKAFDLEKKAALAVADDFKAEPTRSVLLRSAATLAVDSKLPLEAEKLICRALLGVPPDDIAEELRDLLEEVHFERHLDLRGITLQSDEVQMSIAGNAIGYGIAPTTAFLERVELTENLLYRTAERKQRKPYRDRGRRDRALRQNLELYMTVPRAASFAVTFKVGKNEQLSIPGMSQGEEVIDELFECLDLFTHGDDRGLKQRIREESYYRNFVSLARKIAPDGQDVSVVGFTTTRKGESKKVALRATKGDFGLPAVPSIVSTIEAPEEARTVEVKGILKFADSRKRNEIQIVDKGDVRHTIVVPAGMMSDIVRPLWDTNVVVTGVQNRKKIELLDIRPAE